jgi:hypothetical protein
MSLLLLCVLVVPHRLDAAAATDDLYDKYINAIKSASEVGEMFTELPPLTALRV